MSKLTQEEMNLVHQAFCLATQKSEDAVKLGVIFHSIETKLGFMGPPPEQQPSEPQVSKETAERYNTKEN